MPDPDPYQARQVHDGTWIILQVVTSAPICINGKAMVGLTLVEATRIAQGLNAGIRVMVRAGVKPPMVH